MQYAPQIQGLWSTATDSRLFTYNYIGVVEDFYPGKRVAYPRVLPLLGFPGGPGAESDVVMLYIHIHGKHVPLSDNQETAVDKHHDMG
jgi:hypothetical protein